MRIFYNTCIADPWAKVAKKMQVDHNYEVVYWIGYDYDDSENIIPQMFPNACYQSYPDAWKGIFSKQITERAKECYIDIDFLREIAVYELQAIKMMDRLDYDQYSFNFMERERHFLNLLKNWMACLDIYKPDMVVSAVNPHRVYDYVLYLLCKKKNIKYINFQYSMCLERIYAVDNIYSIGEIFDVDYKRHLLNSNLSKHDLPTEVCEQYEKVTKDYSEAMPIYMKRHVVMNKKGSNIFFIAKAFLKKYKLFGKNGFLFTGKVPVTMRKSRKYGLENSKESVIEGVLKRKNKHSHLNVMRKFYSNLASVPVDGESYIFFPLHYQPEATTSPGGDIFVNQRLCVETMLKHTPESYMIYIKEHPQQFMTHMLGQTSRIKEFYTDLTASPRVKLIPLDIDSYSLMANAKAVATVTGTVGWESIMHQKPVILFGMIWYEKFNGVLRITDENSAKKIKSFIESYKFNEHDILAYLCAFSDNSIKAYHYKGRKEKINIPEEDCITNLMNEVLKFKIH